MVRPPLSRYAAPSWLAALSLLLAGCAHRAQTVEQPLPVPPTAAAEIGELRPGLLRGYLDRKVLPDSLALVSAPPAADSPAFAADQEVYQRTRPLLSDAVAQSLTQQIIGRAMMPGDSLPSESDIGKRLGVSKPVVREAIRKLSALGIVDIKQGKQTTVGRPGRDQGVNLQRVVRRRLRRLFGQPLAQESAELGNCVGSHRQAGGHGMPAHGQQQA